MDMERVCFYVFKRWLDITKIKIYQDLRLSLTMIERHAGRSELEEKRWRRDSLSLQRLTDRPLP